VSGKRAKLLRKQVYGDYSLKAKRYQTTPRGLLVCEGFRGEYLDAKREFKYGRISV
jgi:hypothetical protein